MQARAINSKNASLGTIAHTGIMYGAPVIGLSQVPIAAILGDELAPSSAKCWQVAVGFAAHFALGAFLFPSAYNAFARYFLPKRQPQSDIAWAMLLWLAGQNIFFSSTRKERTFQTAS